MSIKLASLLAYVVIASVVEGALVWLEMPVSFLVATVGLTLGFVWLSFSFGWLKLDERSLFSQPLFLISIFLPVYYFAIVGSWAWKGSVFDFSSTGFGVFLEISKLPLLFLASSIPLAAIVNNVHRTIQTEKQIRESEKKNLFDAYYGHLKFVVDQFNGIEGEPLTAEYVYDNKSGSKAVAESQMAIKFPIELYRKIFAGSSPEKGSVPTVSDDFLVALSRDWDRINEKFGQLCDKKTFSELELKDRSSWVMKIYSEIDLAYERLSVLMCLKGYHSKHSFKVVSFCRSCEFTSTFLDTSHLLMCLRSLEHVTHLILEKIYNKDVGRYFSLENPIFLDSPLVVKRWHDHMSFVSVVRYQKPALQPKSMVES